MKQPQFSQRLQAKKEGKPYEAPKPKSNAQEELAKIANFLKSCQEKSKSEITASLEHSSETNQELIRNFIVMNVWQTDTNLKELYENGELAKEDKQEFLSVTIATCLLIAEKFEIEF